MVFGYIKLTGWDVFFEGGNRQRSGCAEGYQELNLVLIRVISGKKSQQFAHEKITFSDVSLRKIYHVGN